MPPFRASFMRMNQMTPRENILIIFLRKIADIYIFNKRDCFFDKNLFQIHSNLIENLNYLLSESDNCRDEIEKIIEFMSNTEDIQIMSDHVNEIVSNLKRGCPR